jgi:HSP20 family protein
MLMRWNDPFKEMKTLQNQIGRLLGDISPLGVRPHGEETPTAMWAPPVDVTETKDTLAFKFEVPGFKQEELTLNLENGVLTLEGERRFEEEQKEKNYHRVERAYGRFYRSFALPANIDVSKVAATLVDGVLNVDLPKREEAKPKAIPIGTGSPKSLGPGRKVA